MGDWRVQIDGTGTPPVEQNLAVLPGTVNTLLVVNGPTSTRVMSVVDATGIAGTTASGLPTTGPVGGVQTGAGGTARAFTDPAAGNGAVWILGVGAASVTGAVLMTLRRRTATA